MVAAIAFLVGFVGRLGYAQVGPGDTDSGADGLNFPTVSVNTTDHEYVLVTYDDPVEFGDAQMQVTSSLIDRLVDGTMAESSGADVRFQIRGDEYYTLPAGSPVWLKAAGAPLFSIDSIVGEALMTIDNMVPARVRPFVTVEDDRVEMLPIDPIGASGSGFSSEPRLETRRLQLRLDHAALVTADPLAAWDAGYFADGELTVWVDDAGYIRQFQLNEDGPALLRIVGTTPSAPDLERELDLGTIVPIDDLSGEGATGG